MGNCATFYISNFKLSFISTMIVYVNIPDSYAKLSEKVRRTKRLELVATQGGGGGGATQCIPVE